MNSIVYVVGSSYRLLSAFFVKTVKELVKSFIKFLDIF
nr:MAG TPA: hypothetical protein [Caudoviricetes sp.]